MTVLFFNSQHHTVLYCGMNVLFCSYRSNCSNKNLLLWDTQVHPPTPHTLYLLYKNFSEFFRGCKATFSINVEKHVFAFILISQESKQPLSCKEALNFISSNCVMTGTTSCQYLLEWHLWSCLVLYWKPQKISFFSVGYTIHCVLALFMESI